MTNGVRPIGLALLAAVAILSSGCAPADGTANAAPAVASADGAAPAQVSGRTLLSPADRRSCETSGGRVGRAGRLGAERCIRTYPDAGKACRGSDDCVGRCLAEPDAAAAGGDRSDQAVAGVCQSDDNPFGCYSEVERGRIKYGICVD